MHMSPTMPLPYSMKVRHQTQVLRSPVPLGLSKHGCRANHGGADGRKALELIAKAKPDLVLLDIVMPEMDGWEVLLQLRNNPKHTDLPVLLLTATADRELIARARALGVRDYLLKGQFSMDE